MSTPIENNTEGLQEILQQVKNLPEAGPSGNVESFFTEETLGNLFDKDNAENAENHYVNYGNGSLVAYNYYVASHYIPVETGKTYTTKAIPQLFGEASAIRVCGYNAAKEFVNVTLGTMSNLIYSPEGYPQRGDLTFTISNADIAYVRVTVPVLELGEFMFVEGSTYPSEYIPYGTAWYLTGAHILPDEVKKTASHLYGKTAIFDGDSIGAGTSALDGLSGWAGRIGSANKMNWRNYATNGGTIASVEGQYCIGGNIDTILANYPKLDYLILEGGTNDTDFLGEDGLGTFSPDDMSGNYDASTFSGALETLLYKAVTYFPYAKIGYIVPHKMGESTHKRRTYFLRAIELCKKWGVPYIDLWTCSHLDRRISAHCDLSLTAQEAINAGKLYVDGQHLSPKGYEVITPKIEAWMKTL